MSFFFLLSLHQHRKYYRFLVSFFISLTFKWLRLSSNLTVWFCLNQSWCDKRLTTLIIWAPLLRKSNVHNHLKCCTSLLNPNSRRSLPSRHSAVKLWSLSKKIIPPPPRPVRSLSPPVSSQTGNLTGARSCVLVCACRLKNGVGQPRSYPAAAAQRSERVWLPVRLHRGHRRCVL